MLHQIWRCASSSFLHQKNVIFEIIYNIYLMKICTKDKDYSEDTNKACNSNI